MIINISTVNARDYRMRYSNQIFVFLILSIATFCNASAKEAAVPVGRYMTVSNKPLPAQRDLLSQIIQIRFPQQVQSIGEAVNHVLRYSGYSMVVEDRRSAALKILLQKSLPLVDRELGPISLKDALITLVGPAFTLVDDPLNREIDFKLKPNFSNKIRHRA